MKKSEKNLGRGNLTEKLVKNRPTLLGSKTSDMGWNQKTWVENRCDFSPLDLLNYLEAGIIEKYGSGIKRVLEAFNKYDLPQPVFEEIQNGFKVSVFKTTQKTTQKTQTRDQILVLLSRNPKMTRKDLAIALEKSPNTVKGHIAKLKTDGQLKRIGSDRNGYWEVISTD